MPITPYIRTPLSDFTGILFTHQNYGKCSDLEMQVIHCYENYGLDMGRKKCSNIIEDFKECFLMKKQMARVLAMKKERERQNIGYAEPPAYDSFDNPNARL